MRISGMIVLAAVIAAVFAAGEALTEDQPPPLSPTHVDKDSVAEKFKKAPYSPYAGRNFPAQVLWGDTHDENLQRQTG